MYVQCAVRVRAVVRRGAEERSFGICRGKVDAHNRTVAYGRSTGIYEHVQIYIGKPGGRPITFLPLSRAQRELRERVHGMRTRGCASVHDERTHSVHRTITNEERGVRETRKER